MSSVKIGVLSDTHRRGDLQKKAIEKLLLEGAQYLLHLGDLENEENLKALSEAGVPYAAVFGNNDIALMHAEANYRIKREPYYLKIKDYTVKMMHLPYYMSADCDLVLFGHLHQFSAELRGKSLFLNPGEVCARNKNLTECVLLELKESEFKVNRYFKEPNAKKWEREVLGFRIED